MAGISLQALHGGHDATIGFRLWYGTPTWARLVSFELGRRISQLFMDEPESDHVGY